jgi:hypothetical protein
MCNVDTGVCIRIREFGKRFWTAYNKEGEKITDSREIEGLLDPTGKTEEQIIADQARAAYLMLLVTHPEIEGDPNAELKLDEAYNSNSDATWFTVDVKIDGETVTLKIGIDERDMYITEDGKVIYGQTKLIEEKNENTTITIRLFQKAFSSLAALFHVVGHEGQHAVDMVRMNEEAATEKRAYDWNRRNDRTYPYYIPWPWIYPIPSGE